MREGFENTLHEYNDLARDLAVDGLTLDAETFTEDDIAELIEEKARQAGTSVTAQEKIAVIQQKKAAIMDRLHERFRAIDDPSSASESSPDALPVDVTEEGTLLATLPNGSESPVSLGELLTDHEWGISYKLDRAVPRDVQKQYATQCAKGELRELLDEQIRLEEEGRTSRRRNGYASGNFFTMLKDREVEQKAGLIAEKLVRTYLKKLAIDHNLPYTIIEADLYQDTIEKIDFIVRHLDRGRGVGVDATSLDTGVQFTLRTDAQTRIEKERAVESVRDRWTDVDDVLVVQASLGDVTHAYQSWKQNKRPGGPTRAWHKRTRHLIVTKVLQDMLPEEEYQQVVEALQYEK